MYIKWSVVTKVKKFRTVSHQLAALKMPSQESMGVSSSVYVLTRQRELYLSERRLYTISKRYLRVGTSTPAMSTRLNIGPLVRLELRIDYIYSLKL